jgi:hypothetical protein
MWLKLFLKRLIVQEGKLYKCKQKLYCTNITLKPGDIIMPFQCYDYDGRRKGRYRVGYAIKFLKGSKISQVRFVGKSWKEHFYKV